MGANFSVVENNESGASRVTAYHSKDQWKTYFEATKQTDKLVSLQLISLIFCFLHNFSYNI
jgi:hypothetical protein